MASITQKLEKQNLIKPKFVSDGIQYEVVMGSIAYGVNNDSSDCDIYGFCIPPKDVVFPHLKGEIQGFGKQTQRFEQFQQHHVKTLDGTKEYDFSIYNIVKYFQLVMENNPNMVDSLYVPERCVLFSTKISNMVRDNRKLFLSKKAWHTFKGYSFQQMHKMDNKNPEGKRKEMIDKFGYDLKFAYHIVRLLNEVEMILVEGDLDLERNREQLKSIRRGEWKQEEIRDYFFSKQKDLEKIYVESKLQNSPNEIAIRNLLINCLEEYYGNLNNCITQPDKTAQALLDIQKIIDKYNS